MKIKSIFVLLAIVLIAFASCNKDDDEDPYQPNNIVTYDTSGLTGELIIRVYHYNGTHNIPAEWGFKVRLFVTYDDAERNEPYLYEVATNTNGVAYFGYINYGDYYVKGTGSYNGVNYISNINVTQVLAGRLNDQATLTVFQP